MIINSIGGGGSSSSKHFEQRISLSEDATQLQVNIDFEPSFVCVIPYFPLDYTQGTTKYVTGYVKYTDEDTSDVIEFSSVANSSWLSHGAVTSSYSNGVLTISGGHFKGNYDTEVQYRVIYSR